MTNIFVSRGGDKHFLLEAVAGDVDEEIDVSEANILWAKFPLSGLQMVLSELEVILE